MDRDQGKRMASKREWLLAVPLLSLLLAIPFWQVATLQGIVITNDIATSDIANLHHPVRHFLGRELQQGRLPLWLPDVYMGYPIQAEGMMGAFYPPNLLLFGLLPPLPALNLSVLLPFYVAAFATYALARKLRAAIWPSLVAAVAYALGGFYIVHVKHMPIVDTACWIPLVWLAIELGLERNRRYFLVAGLIWAVQWLAGSPQLAYYSVGAGVAYYSGRAIQTRQVRKTAHLMALALILSFGLAAVQIWPTAELVSFSERAGGVSFDFASSFGYHLESLWTFLYPYANGDPGTASYQIKGLFWEDYAYIGLLPLLAGVVGGLWLARKNGLARLLFLLAGAAFVLVLGDNTPIFRLAHTWVPGMNLFRFPQRLHAVMTLCLVLIAALSLTRLQNRLAQTAIWRNRTSPASRPFLSGTALLGLAMLSVVVADLYFYHIRQNAIVDAETWYELPQTAQYIRRQDDGLYRVFSIGAVTKFREAYAQAGGWEGDLQPYVVQREFLQPDLNILYDVPTAAGYLNLTPAHLTLIWGNEKVSGFAEQFLYKFGDQLMAQQGFGQLLSLYNVRYLIAPLPFQVEGFEFVGVYGSEAYLYQNKKVLPRAIVVPDYRLVSDAAAALDAMAAPTFDPEREVVLLVPVGQDAAQAPGLLPEEGVLSAPAGFAAHAQVTRYEPLRVVIDVGANRPGFLVLSDLYYPGWKATVDGQPVLIYEANACVRAVPLDEGTHTVEFRFKPKSLLYGAAISVASALVLVFVWKKI